ncbi:transposase [Streptomyces sp. NPDC002888]|uniref:transposase n=1 Tax=Streptomyces sp. NPDC002888 TaxID=3364668 RepID=UPI0036A9ACC3
MKTTRPASGDLLACHAQHWFMSRSPWDHEPVDDRRIDLLMPAPPTAPHDGGVLSPDDYGDRKSGHATAYVSRQYLGSRGRVGNGIVAATTARADERVHHPPHTVPYQPAPTLPQGPADPAFRTKGQLAAHLVVRARAATPHLVAVEPNTPLMTETGKARTPSQTIRQMRCTSPSRRGRRHATRRYRDAVPPRTALPARRHGRDRQMYGLRTAGPSKTANTSSANWAGPTSRRAPATRSNATDAGRRGLRFCWCQLPTNEPPVVSDLARAGAISLCSPELASLSITLGKGIGISLHLPP